MSDTEKLRNEIINAISGNYENHDFYIYINHCIEKWNDIKHRNEAIELIVKFLSDKYNIPKDEFISSNSSTHYSIRGVFFYSLKALLGLSYNDISVMVGRPKGSVYKIITDIEFMVNNGGHKSIKDALLNLTNELNQNNIIVTVSGRVKKD
jgi:hypothetical protein